MSELLFNPFAPGFAEDPYPHYADLRDHDPVQEHPLGFWLVSRYEDVATILRAGLSAETRHLRPHPVRDRMREAAGGVEWRVNGLSMIDRDAPDHTRLRGLVAKVFTPRAIAALEPRVTAMVDAALDRIADAGTCNLVDDLAFPLPFAVINEMLGMPPTDEGRIRDLTGTLVRSLEPMADPDLARRITEADRELQLRTAEAIAWKRAHPADDLLTALIEAENDGEVLSDEELVAQVVLLFVAGHETTVNLISNGAVALLRNPAQLAALRDTPDLVGNAVEELLRFDSPVQSSRRITTAPFEIGGKAIQEGTFLIANLAAANTDERFWGPDAAQLRLDRPNARHHVSFGAGPHHCLGAALARLEGRVALGRLVARFPRLRLAGDVEWNGRINLRGATKVPVTV